MLHKILTNKLVPIISFAITIIIFGAYMLTIDRMDSLTFHIMIGLSTLTGGILPIYCMILSLVFLIKKKYFPFNIIGFSLNFLWLAVVIIILVINK